jgi:hypothetical protein
MIYAWAAEPCALHELRTPVGWKIENTLWRWADGHDPRG